MGIDPVSFQPYIYNTNFSSSGSLGKVAPVPQDALEGRYDFSMQEDITESNPLRIGETKGFMDILAMQLQLGAAHASRLIQSPESSATFEELAENAPDPMDMVEMLDRPDMEAANKASALRNVSAETAGIHTASIVQGTGEGNASLLDNRLGSKGEVSQFHMTQAVNAYMAWM